MNDFLMFIFLFLMCLITKDVIAKDSLFDAARTHHEAVHGESDQPGRQYRNNIKMRLFIEQFQHNISEIDAITQESERPKLRYLAYKHLVEKAAMYSEASVQYQLVPLFNQNKPLEELKNAIKEVMGKRFSHYSKSLGTKLSVNSLSLDIKRFDLSFNEYSPQAENILPEKSCKIFHGGELYYILSFLSGLNKGYDLEEGNAVGIQVHPSHPIVNKITKYNEDGLIERSYEYPIGSSLGYKILFEAEIEAQYLDAANINIEAGLRASNRSHLRNIHIRLRDRALDLDTKKYLIEHVQQLLIRLTGDSPYQNELRKAYRELIINIDSLPEQ